jgi:ankyrin repeat protein
VNEEELRQLCSNKSLDFEKIKILVEFGIDVNGKNKEGWNALQFLCLNNSIENLIDAIKLLIQLGIDVNGKNNIGTNALHLLCEKNSSKKLIDAIKLLIQSGVDVKSNGIDARIILQNNSNLIQEKETIDGIIQILDRAALETAREK